jgi:hypothetical protein
MLLLPPGSRCRILRDRDADIRSISFLRSLVDPLALNGSVDMVIEMLGTASPTSVRLSGRAREDARALFAEIEKETVARTPGFQGMVRLKLMEAILLLHRGQREADRGTRQAPIRFHPADAVQYIQERYADQLTLSGISLKGPTSSPRTRSAPWQ